MMKSRHLGQNGLKVCGEYATNDQHDNSPKCCRHKYDIMETQRARAAKRTREHTALKPCSYCNTGTRNDTGFCFSCPQGRMEHISIRNEKRRVSRDHRNKERLEKLRVNLNELTGGVEGKYNEQELKTAIRMLSERISQPPRKGRISTRHMPEDTNIRKVLKLIRSD